MAGSPEPQPLLGSDHRTEECAASVCSALGIRVRAKVAPAPLSPETTREGAEWPLHPEARGLSLAPPPARDPPPWGNVDVDGGSRKELTWGSFWNKGCPLLWEQWPGVARLGESRQAH